MSQEVLQEYTLGTKNSKWIIKSKNLKIASLASKMMLESFIEIQNFTSNEKDEYLDNLLEKDELLLQEIHLFWQKYQKEIIDAYKTITILK